MPERLPDRVAAVAAPAWAGVDGRLHAAARCVPDPSVPVTATVGQLAGGGCGRCGGPLQALVDAWTDRGHHAGPQVWLACLPAASGRWQNRLWQAVVADGPSATCDHGLHVACVPTAGTAGWVDTLADRVWLHATYGWQLTRVPLAAPLAHGRARDVAATAVTLASGRAFAGDPAGTVAAAVAVAGLHAPGPAAPSPGPARV